MLLIYSSSYAPCLWFLKVYIIKTLPYDYDIIMIWCSVRKLRYLLYTMKAIFMSKWGKHCILVKKSCILYCVGKALVPIRNITAVWDVF
jgi:hypothetical protein